MGDRSYGSDIHTVASLGVACIHGLQEAGIEAIGKHFPGHGRANADSHVAVPEVDAPVDDLLSEAALGAGSN
ncbi:MAG: glycoside hydrolase family 3 N-terminal domain-containing protein [Candidatus Sedimenticola sp. (ex Thyasira tokunagai)]